MTCIVGLEHNGYVYIGGDAAGVDENFNINTRHDEKVFVNDGVIMGYTTSFRMGQLLRYALEIPEQSLKKEDMEFLVVDFIDAVREIFREKGYLAVEEGGFREEGGSFLFGYRGKLYEIQNDFQVGRAHDGYLSCGCGSNLALGSLHSTANLLANKPEERIRMALEAAAHHNAGVRLPYTILNDMPKDAENA